MLFTYEAVCSQQIDGGKLLVSFSAPAVEIDAWGGVPQKKRFDEDVETSGFQREINQSRLKDIATFLRDPRNTVQNPLLCAARSSAGAQVSFSPISDGSSLGELKIEMPSLSVIPMGELFGLVRAYLEDRVPALKERQISDNRLNILQQRARNAGHKFAGNPDVDEDLDSPEVDDVEDDAEFGVAELNSSAALFDESHISEFWEEVAARCVILTKIGNFTSDNFLGFSREVLESYLKPVVVMDGQHRLRGAIEAAKTLLNTPEVRAEAEIMVNGGQSPEVVTHTLMINNGRKLPISLLLDADPAEHVFQFVVVNQRATPIGRALLGTIVSTSLSNDELEAVANRLQRAGIPLSESRAASYMARHPDSPFVGKVDLGLSGNTRNLLPWPVLMSLVRIFRDLQGGKPYHQMKNDYAKAWADKNLDASPIIADFRGHGFETPKGYWSSQTGPWKDVFITFWSYVRDYFGDTVEEVRPNYWGNPLTSNLFNKPSLHILASDFFRFLRQNDVRLESAEHVKAECARWLKEVDRRYFDQDWGLDKTGQKKDSTGIRYNWSKIWDEYRSNPVRLPKPNMYTKATTNG